MSYNQYKSWIDSAKQRIAMIGEPALAVGSAALAEPVSGLAGLVTLPFGGSDAAANNVRALQEYLTYQPRTQAGMQGLQGLQAFLQPVGEVIQGASQNLGDKAYSATGSPALAAAAYSAPTAFLEGLGLKGLNIARKPVSGADLYSARMGAGAVEPDAGKWDYIKNNYQSKTPEKVVKTERGEIRFYDASDEDGIFKDAKYFDNDGNVIGSLFSGPDTDGKWVGSVEVKPEMRRQGIATELYDQMERLSGAKMKPAEKNSADAQAFWKSRGAGAIGDGGNIVRLYHGAPVEFDEFDPARVGDRLTSLGLGHYLTPNKEMAKQYGESVMEFDVDLSNMLDWQNLTPAQRTQIETALMNSIPESRISHFGERKYEILPRGKEGAARFKELKELTKDAYNDYAKARVLDDADIEEIDPSLFDRLGRDDVVVGWREGGDLSSANSQQLMTLMNEFSPELAKQLGYKASKFSDQIAIYDPKLAKRVKKEK